MQQGAVCNPSAGNFVHNLLAGLCKSPAGTKLSQLGGRSSCGKIPQNVVQDTAALEIA